MRISVERIAREMNDAAMIANMNIEAILIPSGRSKTFATVVYTNTADMMRKAHVHLLFRRRAEIDTAIEADDISTKTPVAYAPP